jgi:hypothetical protein
MATINQSYVGPLPVLSLVAFQPETVTSAVVTNVPPRIPVANVSGMQTTAPGAVVIPAATAAPIVSLVPTLSIPIDQRALAAGGGTTATSNGAPPPTTGQLYPLGRN